MVNTVVITPMRVIFLIILVGTTLEVLTERTRTSWRITRWRYYPPRSSPLSPSSYSRPKRRLPGLPPAHQRALRQVFTR
jgi:hypothetical protein